MLGSAVLRVALLLVLLLPGMAWASPPFAEFATSPAGRYLLTETVWGEKLSQALLGRVVPTRQRIAALKRAVQDPGNDKLTGRLEASLETLAREFKASSPRGGTALSTLSRTRLDESQKRRLAELAESYLDRQFFSVAEASTFAARARTFAKPSAQPTDSDLLAAMALLRSGRSAQLLSSPVKRKLLALAGEKSPERLTEPEIQERILDQLLARMPEDSVELALGEQLRAIRQTQVNLHSRSAPQAKSWPDMNREWGLRLLPDDDPALRDPLFLSRMMEFSGASAVGGYTEHRLRSKIESDFRSAWRAIAPDNVDPPSSFTITGTAANNRLYEIADRILALRFGSRSEPRAANILAFRGVYAGTYGKISSLKSLNFHGGDPALTITSPHTMHWHPSDPKEIARLQPLEEQALAQIRARATDPELRVGGILMEPILGASGVYFYRPEFLFRLRALCDELQIAIFADEILTGGGRTGKFFAYQHYEGFEPDYITFGKGLQLAGVVRVNRMTDPHLRPPLYDGGTTIESYAEPMLKATAILRRIHTARLMENAEKSGESMVAHLQERWRALSDPAETAGRPAEEVVRGKGLLIYSSEGHDSTRGAMLRFMPWLTIQPEDIVRIFPQDRRRPLWD